MPPSVLTAPGTPRAPSLRASMMTLGVPRTPGRMACALVSLLLLAFVAVQVWLSWNGYIQSDDGDYIAGAEAWADHGPVLLGSHARLRHVIVLPLALAFRLFGVSEYVLAVVTMAYSLALFGLLAHVAYRASGFWAAVFIVILLASVPVLCGSTSLLFSDVPEAVLLLGSVVCFHRAWTGRRARWLLAAGVFAGLAALTRETAVCVVLFYAGLFLAGYGGNRWAYLWIGLGSLVVVGGETVILWVASGDPLYRLHLTMSAVMGDNPDLPGRMVAPDGLNGEGLFPVPRWIGALLMLFANQAIGPVTWLAIPAACLVLYVGRAQPRLELTRLLTVFAAIWFVMLSWVLQSLFLQPRYQILCLAILTVPLAIVLAWSLGTRWRWAGLGGLAGIVLAGMLLTALSDRRLMQSERQVVVLAQAREGEFRTDPVTEFSARWLLRRAGAEGRVAALPPEPGSLYIYNNRPRRPLPPEWPVHAVPPNWVELQRLSEPRRPLVRLVDALGLLKWLPPLVVRKIDPAPRTTTLYQVPGP